MANKTPLDELNEQQTKANIDLINKNAEYFDKQTEATDAQIKQVFDNTNTFEGEFAFKSNLIEPAIKKRKDIVQLFSHDDVLANLDAKQILTASEFKSLANLCNELGYYDFELELLIDIEGLLLLSRSENMKQQDKLITSRIESSRVNTSSQSASGIGGYPKR